MCNSATAGEQKMREMNFRTQIAMWRREKTQIYLLQVSRSGEEWEEKTRLPWQINFFIVLGSVWNDSKREMQFQVQQTWKRKNEVRLTIIDAQSVRWESQDGGFIDATRRLGNVRHHRGQFLDWSVELIATMLLGSISCLATVPGMI